MTNTNEPNRTALEGLLSRLDETRNLLVEAIGQAPAGSFDAEGAEGESIKHSLDRTIDDLNFYYGRLVARALNLPQPPCLTRSDCGSLREASTALQVAHRRFTNLLHDIVPEDLSRTAADTELGTFTLQQVLEMTVAQYRMREQQIQKLSATARPA